MANQNPGIKVPAKGTCHKEVRQAIQDIIRRLGTSSVPEFNTIKLTGLTASRLTHTDSDGELASTDITDYIASTPNRCSVNDDGDGTGTLTGPQDIHTGASPQFADLTLSGTAASRLLSTNGDKKLLSVGDLTTWIGGTANRVSVTDDLDGSVTLNTPQDTHTGATPEFSGLASTDSIVINKASGKGIKVDTGTPTFGWRDVLGKVRSRGVGATDPNDAVYRGGSVKQYQFSVNDEVWIEFHVPHDYVPGTDMHLHFHWSHNSAIVTGGSVTWGAHITYAKGHNRGAFGAEVNPTLVASASTVQYQHLVSEVQISASSPSATQIDSDDLEPDGILLVHIYLSANNITSSGAVPDPFLHEVDLHYQSTNVGTKQKDPDFYT